MYKQVIVVRSDLKMTKGKLAAQVAHASLETYKAAKKKKKTAIWEREGQKKVILKASNLEKIKEIKKRCDKLKIPNKLIIDAGRTEISPGTITCIGIGPDKEHIINKVTGSLPLVR